MICFDDVRRGAKNLRQILSKRKDDFQLLDLQYFQYFRVPFHRKYRILEINFNFKKYVSNLICQFEIKKLIDCTFQKCHLKKTSEMAGAIIAFKNNFRHFTFYQTGNPRKNGLKYQK